jgi:hypothetical protein
VSNRSITPKTTDFWFPSFCCDLACGSGKVNGGIDPCFAGFNTVWPGVQDKGKAGVITVGAAIYNADSGELLAEQEITTFVRGAGGFGPTPPVARTPAAVATNEPPTRAPDAIVQVG